MKNLRTGISLAALSLSITALASPVLGQEGSGRQGVISFGQEFDYDLDVGLESRTIFGLGLSSATRTETLSFNIGTELLGDFQDGSDDDFEWNNHQASARYSRQGANSALSFSAAYREVDLGDDSFELDPGIILIGEDGKLTTTRFGASIETGIEGPVGLSLDARYRDAEYENTVDPDLSDETVTSVDALARFSLSRSLSLRARAGISRTEEDDAAQTESETIYYGIGLGGSTTSGLTFSADLIFDETETTTQAPANRTTEDGIGFEIAVTQPRPNGTLGVVLSNRIDEAGRRVSAELNRELTLRNGGLGFSLGVVDQEGVDDLQVIGGVSYTTETPQASITVSLEQAATTDDGDTVVSTNLAVAYNRQINAVSSWDAQLGYLATDELAAGEDDNETTATIAYNRDLTSDWSMRTGYEYTRTNDGDDENSIFFNIQRDITFGF